MGRFLEARYTNKGSVGLWGMSSLHISSHILIDHWAFFISFFLLLAHFCKYWEHLYNNRILAYFEVICSCDLLPIYSHKLLIVTSPWRPQQYLWCHQEGLQPEAVRADQLPKNKGVLFHPASRRNTHPPFLPCLSWWSRAISPQAGDARVGLPG